MKITILMGSPNRNGSTILGHSDIGITMNLYVHITEDEKQREIDLVADALKVVKNLMS